MNRKEIFTIPNIMGYVRILLAPVFAVFYLTERWDWAVGTMAISIVSDFFDGLIARKLHQVTELGKFIDPVADKLTQVTLILCLASHFHMVWLLVGIAVVKEGFMAIAGMVMLKKRGRKLDGAKWYGKASTAVTDITMFALLLFPQMPEWLSAVMIGLCGIAMLLALGLYIPTFYLMWIRKDEQSI